MAISPNAIDPHRTWIGARVINLHWDTLSGAAGAQGFPVWREVDVLAFSFICGTFNGGTSPTATCSLYKIGTPNSHTNASATPATLIGTIASAITDGPNDQSRSVNLWQTVSLPTRKVLSNQLVQARITATGTPTSLDNVNVYVVIRDLV